jgi:hypothetical protein
VRPFHVAAWIEDFPGSKPTIKQKLAAVRMLYDFLVVRQITPSNPAHSIRGPKYVVKIGKTPVWSREDARTLLDSIPIVVDDLAAAIAFFTALGMTLEGEMPVEARGWTASTGSKVFQLTSL